MNEVISAYKENWKPCSMQLDDYKIYTTLADNPQSVIKAINDFVENNDCTQDVIDSLLLIKQNEVLLNKTHLVFDGSGRNCTILFRPDGYVDTSYVSDESIIDIHTALNYYTSYAETFFLLLDDETWEEINERESYYFDEE